MRKELAKRNHEVPAAHHRDNGDEARYAQRFNSFTKGLPHDDAGHVTPAAYGAFLRALDGGENADLEAIPMGVVGGNEFRSPQAAYSNIRLDAIPRVCTIAPMATKACASAKSWRSVCCAI